LGLFEKRGKRHRSGKETLQRVRERGFFKKTKDYLEPKNPMVTQNQTK